jgi:hypothetical protein
MKSKYDKNFSENGYLMNYEKAKIITVPKNSVLQFRIELPEILPLIWRRILVPSDYNFWDLHVAVQDAMGWTDSHLHYFEIKGSHKNKEVKIGIPDFDGDEELPEIFPGWEIPILDYFNGLGVTSRYRYDLGDSWWHTIQLEAYFFKEKKIKYPVCIDGARACPPEDCGGEVGYYELIKTLSDKSNDKYEEMKIWVGENWNAEFFDKYAIQFNDPYKRWKTSFLDK